MFQNDPNLLNYFILFTLLIGLHQKVPNVNWWMGQILTSNAVASVDSRVHLYMWQFTKKKKKKSYLTNTC